MNIRVVHVHAQYWRNTINVHMLQNHMLQLLSELNDMITNSPCRYLT